MATLPAPKLLRIVPNTTFDYAFQFILGMPGPGNSDTFDLTGYTGTWTITPNDGSPVTYTSGGDPADSGVFFGGQQGDLTNGSIDLVITAADVSAITWTSGTYTFSLSNNDVVTPVLKGVIGVTS